MSLGDCFKEQFGSLRRFHNWLRRLLLYRHPLVLSGSSNHRKRNALTIFYNFSSFLLFVMNSCRNMNSLKPPWPSMAGSWTLPGSYRDHPELEVTFCAHCEDGATHSLEFVESQGKHAGLQKLSLWAPMLDPARYLIKAFYFTFVMFPLLIGKSVFFLQKLVLFLQLLYFFI